MLGGLSEVWILWGLAAGLIGLGIWVGVREHKLRTLESEVTSLKTTIKAEFDRMGHLFAPLGWVKGVDHKVEVLTEKVVEVREVQAAQGATMEHAMDLLREIRNTQLARESR